MCTGDNILTGLSVARDCAMISEKQKIILVEAEPGEQPKFSYADIAKQMKDNQKPKEIQVFIRISVFFSVEMKIFIFTNLV